MSTWAITKQSGLFNQLRVAKDHLPLKIAMKKEAIAEMTEFIAEAMAEMMLPMVVDDCIEFVSLQSSQPVASRVYITFGRHCKSLIPGENGDVSDELATWNSTKMRQMTLIERQRFIW
jgi:hypothetical protein